MDQDAVWGGAKVGCALLLKTGFLMGLGEWGRETTPINLSF